MISPDRRGVTTAVMQAASKSTIDAALPARGAWAVFLHWSYHRGWSSIPFFCDWTRQVKRQICARYPLAGIPDRMTEAFDRVVCAGSP